MQKSFLLLNVSKVNQYAYNTRIGNMLTRFNQYAYNTDRKRESPSILIWSQSGGGSLAFPSTWFSYYQKKEDTIC